VFICRNLSAVPSALARQIRLRDRRLGAGLGCEVVAAGRYIEGARSTLADIATCCFLVKQGTKLESSTRSLS
jgi:glutathione S-transferase